VKDVLKRGARATAWLWVMAAVWVVALYLNFIYTPDAKYLLSSERIFYVHMGSATAMTFVYLITFVASIGYLVNKRLSWDRWAAASAEVGTVLTTMVLISGIIWGRTAWGVWWTWDPTVTTTLILWVLFLGYLLLRDWTDDRVKRARYAAVLGIVAFFMVPIDYEAVYVWKSIHPQVITTHGVNLAPSMVLAMLVSMVAMMFLAAAWMVIRIRLFEAQDGLEQIQALIRTPLDTL
jgi:heme exporter protein C